MEPKTQKIFISYAWETDEHREWVRELATRLRRDGLEVRLDHWSSTPGDQLTSFMERAIQESDYVVIVCTPDYKQKFDGRVGGVGYEGNLMAGLLLTTGNDRKFVPVLKQGSWKEAAPIWLAGKFYVDLSTPRLFERSYTLLLSTLRGRPPGTASRLSPVVIEAPYPEEAAPGSESGLQHLLPAPANFSVEIDVVSPVDGTVCWYAASSTRPDPEYPSWNTVVHLGLPLWRRGDQMSPFQGFLVVIEAATREPLSLVLHVQAWLAGALSHGSQVVAGDVVARICAQPSRDEGDPFWSMMRGPAYGNVLKFAPVLSDAVWLGEMPDSYRVEIISSTFNVKFGRKIIEAPAAGTFESREPRLLPGDPVSPQETLGWIQRDNASVPVLSDVAGTFVAAEVKSPEVVHRHQPLCQLRFGPSLLTVLVSPRKLRQPAWYALPSPVPGRFVGGITGTGKTRTHLPGAKVKFGTPICAVVCGDLLVGISVDMEGEVLDVLAEDGQHVRSGQPLLEIRADRFFVRSPLVGDFYRGEAPYSDPYVEVGDRVQEGQVLCIIEATKLKIEIVSNEVGIVDAILPQNGQRVEWNEPLFRLRIPR